MKEIFIRRHEDKSGFLRDYPEIISGAMVRIGSVLSGTGPLRGLDSDEEKRYLPKILGVTPDSPNWDRETRAYWADLSIPVGIDGYKLRIPEGDETPTTASEIEDYIKYRFVLRHPEVASSKQVADGSFKARFYIHDPDEEVVRQNKASRTKRSALLELAKIVSGTDSLEKMKRLTRVLVSQNPDRLSPEMMENLLAEAAERNPEQFLSVALDKKLEMHDLVLQLEEASVIQKIGQQYRYNDEIIASTLEEMISFLQNKANSRVLAEMRAKLEEASK